MKAPFPYFGGKSSIAERVWSALGQPAHYIEPFFGSGAVLLNRHDFIQAQHVETINDKDGFVLNAWRSIKFSPDETAKYADWPVNHADLIAKRKILIKNEERLLENLCQDDEWHDPKIAGYWIWAASCWIGSGLTFPNAIPHVSHGGKGVHAKGKIPHVSDGGKGIHVKGQRPHVGDGGKNTNIYDWFNELSQRLRYVRVVCGDWTRVCGGNWQDNMGVCGMFFDPPYADKDRAAVYHKEDFNVAKDVEKWVLERGANPRYRIVVAGYDTEYRSLIDAGWREEKWKTGGGYAHTSNNKTQGDTNRHREVLLYSPHCLNMEAEQNERQQSLHIS